MNKLIGKIMVAALLGAGLMAGAKAAQWQPVNFTSGTIDGIKTFYDAADAAKEDGLLLYNSLTSNLDYMVQVSDDHGANYQSIARIHHDDVDNDYYPVLFPIAKGQLWRIQNNRLVILSMYFFPLGGNDDLTARLAALEQAVAAVNLELGKLGERLDNLANSTAAELAAIKSRLDAHDSSLAQLAQWLAELQEQVRAIQEQQAGDMTEFQHKIEVLMQTINELHEELNLKIVMLTKRLDWLDGWMSQVEKKASLNGWWSKAGVGLGAAGVGIAVGHLVSDDDNQDEIEPAEDCGASVSGGVLIRPGFITGN
jgi:hypothetical protein